MIVTIDGTEYDTDQLSDNAKAQLASLQACENKIRQLQIDLAIVQTARQAYGLALKGEIRGHLTQPYKGAWTVTLTAIPNVEADMVCDSLR